MRKARTHTHTVVHAGKRMHSYYTQSPKVCFITQQKPETKPTHTQWAQKTVGHDEAGRLKSYEEAFVLDFGIGMPVNDPSEISGEVAISPRNVADAQKNIIPSTASLLLSDTINFDQRWNVIMTINSLITILERLQVYYLHSHKKFLKSKSPSVLVCVSISH